MKADFYERKSQRSETIFNSLLITLHVLHFLCQLFELSIWVKCDITLFLGNVSPSIVLKEIDNNVIHIFLFRRIQMLSEYNCTSYRKTKCFGVNWVLTQSGSRFSIYIQARCSSNNKQAMVWGSHINTMLGFNAIKDYILHAIQKKILCVPFFHR